MTTVDREALRALVEKWRIESERHKQYGDCYRKGQGWGLSDCADELDAVLSTAEGQSGRNMFVSSEGICRGNDGMATLQGVDSGDGQAGTRDGGGAVDSSVRSIYAGNGAAHDLIARQLIRRLHLTESDRGDILDVLRLCDLRNLSMVELDRLSIRTGCDTELNRAADAELRRRGYAFDHTKQQWVPPSAHRERGEQE